MSSMKMRLGIGIAIMTLLAVEAAGAQTPGPPPAGKNNFWYKPTDGPTVFVFVHGILSDSRACWLNTSGEKPVYWPELIDKDDRFKDVGIYLGGYYTEIDSARYRYQNAADELFRALNRPDEEGRPPVMTKPNIVFIAHSTGGVVVRYMLDVHFPDFAKKNVGLVLVASPSYGSKQADRLSLLAKFFNNQMGLQLRWSGEILKDLDDRFNVLLNEKRIPYLAGVEACENHFILHRRWLPSRSLVVTEESGARYFRPCKILPGTDHFSTVKPHGWDHPGYLLLLDFYEQEFVPLLRRRAAEEKQSEAAAPTQTSSRPPVEKLLEGIVPGFSRDYVVSKLGPAQINNTTFPVFCEGFQQDVYAFPEAYVGITYDPDNKVASVFVLARTDDFRPVIPILGACLGCETFFELETDPSLFNWSSKEWYYIESISAGMAFNDWTVHLMDNALGRGHQHISIDFNRMAEMVSRFREKRRIEPELQQYRQSTKPNGYAIERPPGLNKNRREDATCMSWYNIPLTYFTINSLSG